MDPEENTQEENFTAETFHYFTVQLLDNQRMYLEVIALGNKLTTEKFIQKIIDQYIERSKRTCMFALGDY